MNSWDVARLTVRLGDYDIKTASEVRHIEKRVKRVVRHRGFDMRTLYNDVALLTLNEPIEFSETVRPVCLPSGSNLYVGKKAIVIGWGSLREGKCTNYQFFFSFFFRSSYATTPKKRGIWVYLKAST